MKIKSIEPTPSPNTMKLTLNENLPQGKSNNYTAKNKNDAPEFIQQLFLIEGIKGVYHVADFIALERNAKVDWKQILPKVREAFGENSSNTSDSQQQEQDGFGEVKVYLHFFKGIPMQIKVTDGEREVRVGLPDAFKEAAVRAQKETDNVVMERKWVEQNVRYGELEEVGEEVKEEVLAAYSEERLEGLVASALGLEKKEDEKQTNIFSKLTVDMLDNPDWKKRYAALDRIDPTEEDIPALAKALEDEKASIRRLATVYLGMIEKPVVLPYLYKALEDSSVTVRRTAGDCLSDIGDAKAMPAMMKALQDKNKLVRWRAAMFLYEVGDQTALEALKQAEDDPEFEVSMQVKMAIERIETGEEAKGSVWKQMTEAVKEK
ncbi:conserved virulence factor C family protein [Alkalihalobacillus sp. LMS39]|uniref:conserved virulence factor C family protein n=1 Tax=Alkalihalobacillus sp. LMS39 TaxID=2924032 RepID=UPI001FB3B17C|nr:conserved virulence factor C family protein [Alkalihalobacillus sp. LMS39]UOE92278.1 conserved virulence factor C family protein [Alkalihalobacillus sp. LMS39]